MNTDFWARLHEANKFVEAIDRFVEGGKRYGYDSPIKAEPLGDSNMPEGVPTATVGTCLACAHSENHPTLFFDYAKPDQELGNGLCAACWYDCVTKMPHYSKVDPDFEIWKELCSP